jgi:hypothetical protein
MLITLLMILLVINVLYAQNFWLTENGGFLRFSTG